MTSFSLKNPLTARVIVQEGQITRLYIESTVKSMVPSSGKYACWRRAGLNFTLTCCYAVRRFVAPTVREALFSILDPTVRV